MALNYLDWLVIILFFCVLISIGLVVSKGAGNSTASYFLSERNNPWWLLGISMVATTFSADTPNFITDLVRTGGVAYNWIWWVFLLTGMLTVFIYSKLWNRSQVMTDLEFYEIRYGGKIAAFLRGFRAIYLGFLLNVLIIASVSLAFIKISSIMLGISPITSLCVSAIVILIYSILGGLKSILWTDLFQFTIALVGAIISSIYVVNSPEIGGLSKLFNHPSVVGKMNFIPDINSPQVFLIIFLIPITIQWWAAWYPGAEPGGGGHIAQRMLSAKSEKHALGATLLFNIFHYAIRPWPWIVVGLASLIVFPDIQSMIDTYPEVDEQYIKNDFAYPAMLREFLPAGILGLVVASLIAAYMSTVASLLNLGSSYLVNDFYGRFINKNATERRKVKFGKLFSIIIMAFSIVLALFLENALQAFQYILMLGAGTGLIYILRWFWWRISAYSEIAAMVSATFFSLLFILIENSILKKSLSYGFMFSDFYISNELWNILKFVLIVLLTTLSWLVVTLLSKPESDLILRSFYKKIKPGGVGWKHVIQKAESEGVLLEKHANLKWDIATGLICMTLGSVIVYSILFLIGSILYQNLVNSLIFLSLFLLTSYLLWRSVRKLLSN